MRNGISVIIVQRGNCIDKSSLPLYTATCFFKINLFIYFWLRWVLVAARGLFLVAASWGYSLAVRGLLIVVASLVAEHGL